MSPLGLLWLLAALVTSGSSSREADGLCGAPCTATSDPRYPRGMRYTYRYSTVSTSSPPHAPSESSGLALDCLLDVDVLPGCQLTMKLRNSQIKRVSPQKENSAQRIKNLREALERNPLMFSLRDGKVAQVCPWEGDPVWALNIKRAIVSMLQTSHAGDPRETVKETDVYGTCVSHYERRGSVLVKTRDLRGCLRDRLAGFWLHSVPLSQDNAVESSVQCVQRHGDSATEEVNCTETVRLAPLAGRPVGARVRSVSTLTLLRAQDGAPVSQDLQVYSGDVRFEDETGGPARARQPDTPESADTVRKLCAIKSDQQQQTDLFLHLVFQLRVLSHRQLQQLWQEASFKCRDDWQPLLDALPACGSEACVSVMTELLRSGELEPERVSSFLSAFAFVSRPSAAMVGSTTGLLQSPETRTGALLAVSSMVHTLCLRMTSPCSLLPQVQQLLKVLKEMLEELCGEGDGSQLTEKLHVLKAVGNAGLAAATLIPELEVCAQSQSTPMELRLAAIQAFRRIPCTADRRALLQLYCSPREDVEVRITAYQQIMRCPDRDVLRRVRATLKNESSSQVGSYVWSHLTQIQKTDDPLKQTLMEMLPDDIISKDFEGETWKYSSYMDTTMDTGFGSANMEGALVFAPSSIVPRSAMVNLTAHILGRAFNLLEIDLRVENADPLLRKLFGHHEAAPSHDDSGPQTPVDPVMREKRSSEGTVEFNDDGPPGQGEKGGCQARSSHLRQAGAMFTGHQPVDHGLRCGIGVKVFGSELVFITCDDVAAQGRQLSLSLAGMAVRLLKGQDVQFHRQAILATEELILPSLSGWPIKVAVNMSALLSIRIKGSAILKSWSHFSVSGYVKPSAYVGVSARMGLEGPCGRAGVEWLLGLRSSTSLDGGVQLQRGQDLKVSLNTPEDSLDIVHFSSRMYSVSGENREELRVSRDHTDRTTCSPQDWSRVLGWQLCSQVSYPSSPGAVSLPPPGPVLLSIRLQKLDRGLQQYLLEAAYSLIPQKGSWLPTEASLHLFLGTPQSSIPRDLSLDFTFSSPKQRLLLKIRHPLKSIQVQGQIDQARNTRNAKLELWVDGVHHYYVKVLTDVQTLPAEQKLLTHLEAKLTAGGRPVILSANLTRGLGRKISLSAMMRNVFKETASLSVLLERRLELAHRQYSVDVDLLLPGLLGTRVFGLMQNRASQWSSALRVKYGLRGDARNLRHECHTAQTARNELQPNETHHLRAEHELHCSNAMSINHKLLLRHEEGPGHVRSVLDLSYGKHWDEINNKRRVLLSQSFKNQSRHALTSYLLEFSLQVLEKHLSYRTQLLHSHLRQKGAESSTHLKVNYNDQLPLIAGLHWRDLSKARLRRWEGAFNMDTPWLYVYTAHKLSQPQRRAVQFSTEITTRKWVTLRSLVLEGFYREKSREREGRLHLYTPTDTYFKISGWGTTGKQSLKASGALSSVWTPTLRGDLSLEGKKDKKALQLVSSYGRQNITISASVVTMDKRLRKRLVAMKVVLMEPKGLPVELELEGAVEELKRDRELYQKQGTLRLRQPFLHFPQKLLLHEVFTVDLRRSRYILESRAVLSGNKECLHRLTLSYHPDKPSVCSALTHPFRSETIPQDSELCVTLYTNQSQQEVQGTVRVNRKDKLIVLGQVQNISDPSQQGWVFQVNLTHLLQIQVPQSASLQGALYWKLSNNSMFGYLATGKAVVDHQRESQFAVQLNGSSREVGLYSSFSQHHSSAVPKTFEAHARAEREGGRIGTSVYVKTDGADRANLQAELVNVAEEDTRLLGARAVLRQRLVPILQDLDVQLSTNVSADRMSAECSVKQAGGSLQAQLSGALEPRPGLRASVRGGLQHSLASLPALPPTLGLEGALRQSQQLTEGQLTMVVGEAAYGLELHHHGSEGPGEQEQGVLGVEPGWARAWLHMRGPGQNLHVNVSSNLGDSCGGGLHATLSHSSAQLLAAGLPSNSSMRASWTYGEHGVSSVTELQVGSQGLRAEVEGGRRGRGPPRWELFSSLRHHCTALLERGIPRATDVSGHYQAEPHAMSAGVAVQVDQRRKAEVLVEGGRTNGSVRVAVLMEHGVKRLLGVLPTRLQMDCSGDGGAEQLSGRCSGAVADQPIEVQAFRRWGFRPHCSGLQLRVGRQAAQAEGCYDTLGRDELTASAVHSSGALHSLGLPRQARLRALLEPGAGSWRCVLSASIGRMNAHLSGELRVVPVCRWRGLASYRGPGSPGTVEVRSLVGVRRCHLEAEFSTVLGKGTSSLAVLAHCGSLRIKGARVQEGPRKSRTSFVAVGRMGQNRVTASLVLKQNRDALSCRGSLLLLERTAELGWTLRHRWASLRRTVPERLSMDGWGRVGRSSMSGGIRLALGSRTAQLDVSTAWRLDASLRAALRHGLPPLKAAGIPEDSLLNLAIGSERVCADLLGAHCAVSARGDLQGSHRETWRLTVRQRCAGLQMRFPRQFSVNGTVATAACGLHLDTQVESAAGEGAGLNLVFDCASKLRLQATAQHTLPPLQRLGVPAHNTLTVSVQKDPAPAAMLLDLTLGRCELRVQTNIDRALGPEETGSSWAANLTNRCLVLKEAGVPESLELSGLLSLSPCRSALSCSLTADGEALALQLSHSCRPTHSLTGAVTHSFSRLGSWGLPSESRLVLMAPGGPGRDGTLLLKAGSCRVRASGDVKPGGRSLWVWTAETECPLLEGFSLPAQSRFNGSLLLEDCALEVRADARVDGHWASVRLTAGCRQGLRLEGLPEHGSLMPECRRAPPLQYGAELELRVRRCALGVSGGLRTAGRLEGSLLLHNNCTALQHLGAPSRVEGHGSLLMSTGLMDSRVSLVSGDTHLRALLSTKAARNRQEALAELSHSATLLREVGLPTSTALAFSSERGHDSYRRAVSCSLDSQQISEDLSVERTGTEVRVEYRLDHSVGSLRGWGVPENNSVQAELDFGQARRLSVRSRLGDRFVSLGARLKDAPACTEVAGVLEHSWAWLREKGLPSAVEVLCSIQGSLPQLQARAHLSTDGEKLLASALNVSLTGGRLALLLSLAGPPHLVPGPLRGLDAAVTAHYRGSQKHASVDLYCNGTRVRLVGEATVWGAGGREARVALQHSREGEDKPTIQVEAWGRLTETQLRGSLAWNPKTNSSLAITVQGHNLPSRKELNCKVHQSIPALQLYLPPQLDAKTQVNHTGSTLHGFAEVKLGGNKLQALGELSIAESGYKQAVEVKHSFPQLKSLPGNVALNSIYEGGNHTCRLQQRVVWGGQELSVSGQYLSLEQERGTRRLQVQMTGTFAILPSACGLDVQLERSAHRLLDSILLDWKGQGTTEKVRALCSRTSDDELWEGRVELRQPFTPPLSHLHLRALSHTRAGGQGSSHQAWLSWNDGKPMNVTVTVNRQWQGSSTRGQACLSMSPGQVRAALPFAELEGCGSVAREGNSYSQTAELKWGGKRITQAMKYQRGARGGHTLQLEGGADNVSPQPCPSHTFLAQVHTNGRDRLEHHLLLGLCPPHPSWAVSGYHRVGTGQELLYSQTRLSVSGQSQYSGLTVVLTNTSMPLRTNFSFHTELQVGDGALELGGSVFSSRRGGGLQVGAVLDRSERLWLQGALEGRCVQAAAGYNDGVLSDDNLTVALCLEGRRHVILEVQRTEDGVKPESLASISLRAANQSLTFTAQACMESLQAAEARACLLGSRVRNKLLDKIRVLQRLLLEIRRQDNALLWEMSERPLRWAQKAEALLVQRVAGAWAAWRKGVLRHSLTNRLPRCLESLRHLSQQLQQELKRPLATLAGAYQDATGRRLDAAWKETVVLWSRKLAEQLPAVLEEHQLGAPLRAALGALTAALDLVSQQMAQWAESRLGAALVGIRRRLASLYKLSHGRCEVSVQLPLPRGAWSDVGGAGMVEFLLDEWLLRPMVTVASLRPAAELYRLKRRMMESPFNHQALLVSDQFALSFDGRLYELPGHCPLLLARDLMGGSFTMVLSPNTAPERTLLVEMSNTTVSISPHGQVEMNCRETDESFSDSGVSVRRDGVLIQVSNQNGALLSCDLSQEVCSLTLDGWQHGVSMGLLGTNDNEAGNELTLPDGSQADGEDHFLQSWQLKPHCRRGPCSNTSKAEATSDLLSCASLFSDLDSPLGSCFRVVDPGQFLAVCERSRCHRGSAPCRLAAAFVHLCRRNYVPLDLPELCVSV